MVICPSGWLAACALCCLASEAPAHGRNGYSLTTQTRNSGHAKHRWIARCGGMLRRGGLVAAGGMRL